MQKTLQMGSIQDLALWQRQEKFFYYYLLQR